jgi:hypothetical protein
LSPARQLRARSVVLDALILFGLTALLILPLFRIEYFNNWMSIEGSFIGDARYIAGHWPHPSWHALWYCGTRFDYIYPPATRYGAAMAAMLLHVPPARGYHIFVAVLYCAGVSGVYFLTCIGSRSRVAGWCAACAYAVLSPEFAFLGQYRVDSLHTMPERLNTLIKWGEGPHASALALIPWALGFGVAALRGNRPWSIGASALCCAMVVSNNLYGAMALGMFYPALIWSMAICGASRAFWLRAAAIPVLAGGLCAWWLTPSYIALTRRNLALVALPGNVWSIAAGLIVLAIFVACSLWAVRRFAASGWCIFVAGATLAFSVEVFGQYGFHFRVWGEPMRFVLELDMAMVLMIVEILRIVASRQRWVVVVLAVIGFAFSFPYVSAPWSVYVPDPNWRDRIEYRMSNWLADELPGSRVFTSGSVSFWQSAWRDVAQVGGASDQGMQNLLPAVARYQIMVGDDAERDILWLQAFGADALVVNGPGSREIYHSIKMPEKYQGKLSVLYQKDGDVVYRIPRRTGLARIVNEQEVARLPAIPFSNEDRSQLQAYVDAIERVPEEALMKRRSIDEIDVEATAGAGQSVSVQVSFDPGWSAWVDGRATPILEDTMHFMRVRVSPGTHTIHFTYGSTIEMRTGRWITVASLLALIVLCFV